MIWLPGLLLTVLVFWAISHFYLRGEDLSRFDQGSAPQPPSREPSSEHHEIVQTMRELASAGAAQGGGRERLLRVRAAMDEMGDQADLAGVDIVPVDVGGLPGEWVLSEGADPKRRLLYLHGGAFTMGSSRSHRPITSALSRLAGASVLCVDYRLMPENKRLDCLTDCQTAYRWIIDNGPDGAESPDTLFVAGDSAGGNLALVVIAWARDVGLRACDAAVALSPATDSTFASPSLGANVATDHMLGPMMGRITKVPRAIMLWFSWITQRVPPADPRVSPLRGDLANLPPTLVHASEAEMLLDDARRYVNKATHSGSQATLVTWHHMLHVWHIFDQRLPEAREALQEIGQFLETVAPRHQSAAG